MYLCTSGTLKSYVYLRIYHYFQLPLLLHMSTESVFCPDLINVLNFLNALWLHIQEYGNLKGKAVLLLLHSTCAYSTIKSAFFIFGTSVFLLCLISLQSQYTPMIHDVFPYGTGDVCFQAARRVYSWEY